MIKPQPLSKEQLAEFADLSKFDEAHILEDAIESLLAAEQFWREAVKASKPFATK